LCGTNLKIEMKHITELKFWLFITNYMYKELHTKEELKNIQLRGDVL